MLKCMIGTKYILSIVGKGERDVVMSSNNSKEIVIYIYIIARIISPGLFLGMVSFQTGNTTIVPVIGSF